MKYFHVLCFFSINEYIIMYMQKIVWKKRDCKIKNIKLMHCNISIILLIYEIIEDKNELK